MKSAVLVLLLSLTALAQAPAEKSANPFDEGFVSGNTYSNDYFEFSFTFPEDLEVNDEFMAGHQDADRRAFVLLALERHSAEQGYKDMLVVMADRNTNPAVTTGAQYLAANAHPHFQQDGFEAVNAGRDLTISGHAFARVDYHKGDVYQSLVATIWRGYALVFNVAAPSSEAVDKLLASLDTLQFAPSSRPGENRARTGHPVKKP